MPDPLIIPAADFDFDPEPAYSPPQPAADAGPPPVWVIGHRNPDTDAICSAIGYAAYLRQTRLPQARAARCGEMNIRTAWALEQAGVEPPQLLVDVRPTAGDICRRHVTRARADETFLTVYQRMMEHGVRSIPVIDDQNRVEGMIYLRELLGLLLPAATLGQSVRHVEASLDNIARVLEATVTNPGADMEPEETLLLLVGASSEELVRRRLHQADIDRHLVLVGDRPRIQRLAVREGVRALIITGGCEPDPEALALAVENRVCVLTCARDTASTAQLIRCARSVRTAVVRTFESCQTNSMVRQLRENLRENNQPLYPVIDPDSGCLAGVFSKSDMVAPPRQKLVLVDHNEFSQAVTGADEAEILEVIDHHRLSGNLVTREPVRFVNEPVGSTSTMAARFFQLDGLQPERGVAVCLCAGIISDTLNLTSPTTTDTDRAMLPWLAGIAGIDPEAFTRGFFSAGSVLRSQTAAEALRSDRKAYVEADWAVSISQIEELGLDMFWGCQDDLRRELEGLVGEENLDFACLMVTDITKHDSVLLAAGKDQIIRRIDYPRLAPGVFALQGVVSRKKQLFPMLSRVLGEVRKS